MTESVRHPRVALVSVGLGRVQRGFERYFTDLFETIRDEVDVTLFMSAGERAVDRRVPPLLKTTTAMARRLPLGRLAGSREYNRDCLAFAFSMMPQLLRGRYDIVHCIDPPLAIALSKLRPLLGRRTQVLFTEGCNMPPAYYPRVDHIHHVGWMAWQEAVDAGVARERMTLVPCGLHASQFRAGVDRDVLRERWGISDGAFVVLAISAIKRTHKRVHHLIDEVAGMEGDILLWLDGNPEDDELVEHAKHQLGSRLRITHVATERVPELYGLADVLAHASLTESFGLSLVEAGCAGLPVVAHDSPHFEWLLGDRRFLVDMRAPGELRRRLVDMVASRDESTRRARAAALAGRVAQRFDWSNVRSEYIRMYRAIATAHAAPRREAAQAGETISA